MASLTGTQIANTYKQLLQVGTGNVGLTSSLQTVQDGDANNSPLQLSNSAVNINGTFQLNGTNLDTTINSISASISVNSAAITSINAIIGDGGNYATSAELAATSLALATSIGTANTRITSVSNFAVALSATLATSIGTANTRITSVSNFAVALSATLATSIGNSNTNIAAVSVLTSINTAAITSVSDFAVALSATMATSIGTANTRITSVSDFAVALSATMATSIGNSNTNITTNANAITSINTVVANVSALTSVNAAAITSINGVIEGNVSADSGTFNTLTVVTSASVGGTLALGDDLSFTGATPNIIGGDDDGNLLISGGISTNDGANLNLLGGAHATLANDVYLRASGTQVYRYDHSATEHVFSTGGTEALTIDSDGVRLGGATSYNSATSFDTLVIGPLTGNGGICINAGSGGNGGIAFADDAVSTEALINYDFTTDRMLLQIQGSTKVAIDADGLKFNGDTAAANALDDYEEGTFTPVIADASSGGNTGTGTVSGIYTKVGRLVTATISLVNINTTGMTAGNTMFFRGLPFTSGSSEAIGSVVTDTVTLAGRTWLIASMGGATTWVTLKKCGSATDDSTLVVSDFSSGVSDVATTISYMT